MPRYVEVDALIAKLMARTYYGEGVYYNGMEGERDNIIEIINEAPTIETPPVVRGEWVSYTTQSYRGEDDNGEPILTDKKYFMCSNPRCHRRTVIRENFCPNCGADMRPAEKGGDGA